MRSIIAQIIAALGIAAVASASPCQYRELQYGTTNVFTVCLKKYDSTQVDDNEKIALKTDATFSAGDVKISTSGGAETNIGTLPSDSGSCYTQIVSAAEATGSRFYITYTDQDSTQVWIATCVEGPIVSNARKW